jgi:hypothetical protein
MARRHAHTMQLVRDELRSPFTHSDLGAIRLLVSFMLFADEARPMRNALAGVSGECPDDTWGRLLWLVAAAREHPPTAWTLDSMLSVLVGERAAHLDGTSVENLIAIWRTRGREMQGLDLVAFVWQIARDDRIAVRPLERKLVRETLPTAVIPCDQRSQMLCALDTARGDR